MNKYKKSKRPQRKRKSLLSPPYFSNRNQHFEQVRKRMTMKTDGPTLNEMSSLDTTDDLEKQTDRSQYVRRPVTTKNQIRNWWNEGGKQIIKEILIAVIVSVVLFVMGNLVYHHNIHLTEHDKDIEYLKKSDTKQDCEIDVLKEKTHEINTDVKLLEQKVELSSLPASTTTNKKK